MENVGSLPSAVSQQQGFYPNNGTKRLGLTAHCNLPPKKMLAADGCFLKWWVSPTTIGFPTKNDHFGVFWGYHYFGNIQMGKKTRDESQ